MTEREYLLKEYCGEIAEIKDPQSQNEKRYLQCSCWVYGDALGICEQSVYISKNK